LYTNYFDRGWFSLVSGTVPVDTLSCTPFRC